MTVRGIEAIKLYMPPTRGKLNANVKEEKGQAETTTQKVDSPQDGIEAAITINPMERYRQEWQQLLQTLDENPDNIRDLAFDGHLQTSKFRSVYWCLLLRVLNGDRHTWSLQRQQQRKRYDKLKQEFSKNPHHMEGNPLQEDDNPLSQSSQSAWNQYFSDQELFAVIRQDVIRTFPGVDFFRKPLVQEVMNNILFFYAREHPYMCYRQGMHEILAPVIFVAYGDHQSFLQFKEIAKNVDIDETLVDVLNPLYLEADSYFLFSRIMASIESYYRISNGLVKKTMGGNNSFDSSDDGQNNKDHSTEVEVVGQLNLIRDKILAKEDLHLHNYLMKLDIPLHIFGIRWLRLLFGREFALLDLLILWDAIFADSDRFELPNYIVVAMLIRIRDKLLLSDYTTCLTYLMRYPPNVDISLILRHALHMQMPKKYDRPSNAFIYFNMPTTTAANQVKSKGNLSNNNRRKSDVTHATAIDDQSLGDNAIRMERQITLMQTRNAADEALMARLQHSTEESRLAMDGYKDNTPELMRLELKNVQTVITVARSKLQTYLQTLRRNMSSRHTSHDVTDALDGIEELCQFLDVKFMIPLYSRTAPIDEALEANEQQLKLQQRRQQKTESFKDNASERDLDSMPNLSIQNASNTEATPSNSSQMSYDHAIVYELPDNGFMLQSSRVLGNVKEIELMQIVSDEKIVDSAGNSSISNGGMPVADPLSLKNY